MIHRARQTAGQIKMMFREAKPKIDGEQERRKKRYGGLEQSSCGDNSHKNYHPREWLSLPRPLRLFSDDLLVPNTIRFPLTPD